MKTTSALGQTLRFAVQVSRSRKVEAIPLDRVDMRLHSVETAEVGAGTERDRRRAEGTHSIAPDTGLSDPYPHTLEGLDLGERPIDAQQLAHRPGRDADAHDSERLEPVEHLVGDLARDNLLRARSCRRGAALAMPRSS